MPIDLDKCSDSSRPIRINGLYKKTLLKIHFEGCNLILKNGRTHVLYLAIVGYSTIFHNALTLLRIWPKHSLIPMESLPHTINQACIQS
jgi:hypothetical protein